MYGRASVYPSQITSGVPGPLLITTKTDSYSLFFFVPIYYHKRRQNLFEQIMAAKRHFVFVFKNGTAILTH